MLKAFTHGTCIYAINKLPRQLPYSHVHMYTVSMAGAEVLRNIPLLVGLAKCGHVIKTLAARKRHYDFITFLGIPRKWRETWAHTHSMLPHVFTCIVYNNYRTNCDVDNIIFMSFQAPSLSQ